MGNLELIVINEEIFKTVPEGFHEITEYLGGLEVLARKSRDNYFWVITPQELEAAFIRRKMKNSRILLRLLREHYPKNVLIPASMAKIAV